MRTIGFVGAGNMAEAILQGIVTARLVTPTQVWIHDVQPERCLRLQQRYGVTVAESNAHLARAVDILVLCVKPYHLADVLRELQGQVREGAVLASIIAGKRIAEITQVLGERPVIRVMPNTPALLNEGASALYANAQARDHLPRLLEIFACVGRSVEVDSEDLIDVVTAVSGSGPAYYYLLMECMIDTAVSLGLPPELARVLVLQTAKGAALLAAQAADRDETPADLTRKVATPGGTTEAALEAFMEGGIRELVERALTCARDRSRELSGDDS